MYCFKVRNFSCNRGKICFDGFSVDQVVFIFSNIQEPTRKICYNLVKTVLLSMDKKCIVSQILTLAIIITKHPCCSHPVKTNPVENPVEIQPKILQPSEYLSSQVALLVNSVKNCQNPMSFYCFPTSKMSHIFNPVSFEILTG